MGAEQNKGTTNDGRNDQTKRFVNHNCYSTSCRGLPTQAFPGVLNDLIGLYLYLYSLSIEAYSTTFRPPNTYIYIFIYIHIHIHTYRKYNDISSIPSNLTVKRSHHPDLRLTISLHDLDNLEILTCRYEMLCRICTVQVNPRKHAIDHADFTAPTR